MTDIWWTLLLITLHVGIGMVCAWLAILTARLTILIEGITKVIELIGDLSEYQRRVVEDLGALLDKEDHVQD